MFHLWLLQGIKGDCRSCQNPPREAFLLCTLPSLRPSDHIIMEESPMSKLQVLSMVTWKLESADPPSPHPPEELVGGEDVR
mmetsp:Transcript_42641/g.129497  ORF Transcript_42641/g.129497 Transcript_42641/m.129497 type:complete len:81 (-) Transcript_42641:1087-1329(-)